MSQTSTAGILKRPISLIRQPEFAALAGRLLQLDDVQLSMIELVDEVPPLIMLHYREGGEITDPKVLSVRGVVIDTSGGYVVAPGQKMLSHCVVEQLQPDEEGYIELVDNEKRTHRIHKDDPSLIIEPFINGVNLRCFRHNSRNYCTTYHRFDPEGRRSRWYDHGTPFVTMYQRANGPTMKTLFPDEIPNSPYIYRFNVFHPELNLTILFNGVDGFVRYDGHDFNINHAPKVQNESEPPVLRLWDGAKPIASFEELKVNNGAIIMPSFTLEQANRHLRFGHQEQRTLGDVRIGGGESIIIRYKENGVRIPLHIRSPAYEYRESMGYDQSNRYMSFIHELVIAWNDMKDPENFRLFNKQLVPLKVPEDQEIDRRIKHATLMHENEILTYQEMKNYNREQVQRVIWYNWLISATEHYRPMVRKFLERYTYDKNRLASWLIAPTSEGNLYTLDFKSTSERRCIQIQSKCSQILKQMRQEGRDQAKTPPGSAYPTRTRSTLDLKNEIYRNLVSEELPESFYRLVRTVNECTGSNSIHITEPTGHLRLPSTFPPLTTAESERKDATKDGKLWDSKDDKKDKPQPTQNNTTAPRGRGKHGGAARGAEVKIQHIGIPPPMGMGRGGPRNGTSRGGRGGLKGEAKVAQTNNQSNKRN